MKLHRFVSSLMGSNTWLVEEGGRALVVDAGLLDSGPILSLVDQNQLQVDAILLTHEHADHIVSLGRLREVWGCPVLASASCNARMTDPDQNMSRFHEECEDLSPCPAEIEVSRHGTVVVGNWNVECWLTPGHSPAGLVMRVGSFVFTGDTLIPGLKTVTKLPGGDRKAVASSLDLLRSHLRADDLICPGHEASTPWSAALKLIG